MKILLLGEYSNVHATLADGLRQLGHEVLVISDGDRNFDYERNVSLSRKGNGKWAAIRYVIKLLLTLPKMKGFDIVQLINPDVIAVKAERQFAFYRYLRRHNKAVILGSYGNDWQWVEGGKNRRLSNDCDGIVTSLYEYHLCYQSDYPEKTLFIPLPVRLMQPRPIVAARDTYYPIRFFLGIKREVMEHKGTDIFHDALQKLKQAYPDKCCVTEVEDLPFAEYTKRMEEQDVILDQAYSYTPAMNALQVKASLIEVVVESGLVIGK